MIEREKVGALPIWGWGLVTSLLVWSLYVFTLAPTTGFWDASEYIATAHILGLPHPPGNPLFVVLGRTWDLALEWTGLSVAVRINLLCATLSAAASYFWFLTIARVSARFWENRAEVVVSAVVAVLVGATAFTVWSQSNLNEKVYTVSLFTVALVSYLAIVWLDDPDSPRGGRLVLLVAFLLGLGRSNHTMSVLPIPALAVLVLWHRWRTLLRWRLMGAAAALFVLGFSVQLLFVPIRSAQEPIIDEADPECASVWDAVRPGQVTDRLGEKRWSVACESLGLALIRDQYGKPPLSERQSPPSAQLAMYWQYFDWQWARTLPGRIEALGRSWPGPRAAATMLFLFLAFLGLWQHAKGDRKSFAYLGTLLFTLVPLLIFYLNFEYGYSLYTEEIPNVNDHEVRERDYFYIIGFNVWGLYAGLGLVALWRQLSGSAGGIVPVAPGPPRVGESPKAGEARGRRGDEAPPAPRWWFARGHGRAAPVLALALVPLVFNYGRANRTGDYAARDWAYNILQSVEPYGVLFTNGDNDTFPLWYLQEVEGIRRDVTVIVHSYLGTRWYPKQLRELTKPCPEGVDPLATPTVVVCQRPFDAESAVAPYADHPAPAPTRSIIGMTDEELDLLGYLFQFPRDTTIAVNEWVTATLAAGDVVSFGDVMVFHILRESLSDRPVYFAATAPPVYGRWRFQPHLMRQGLAHKVVNGPLVETPDTLSLAENVPLGTVPWIHRSRTRELLWNVFQIDYLLGWDLWPEPSTRQSIPLQYLLAYRSLGITDELLGDEEEAVRNYERAEAMGVLMGLDER